MSMTLQIKIELLVQLNFYLPFPMEKILSWRHILLGA